MVLSKELERALHRSLNFAVLRRHKYAGVEHLLLEIIDDPDAGAILKSCGTVLDTLRDSLSKYVDELKEWVVKEALDPELTVGFRRAVERAAIRVAQRGGDTVTGSDVLISLYSETESKAVYFLESQGITLTEVSKFDLPFATASPTAQPSMSPSAFTVHGHDEAATDQTSHTAGTSPSCSTATGVPDENDNGHTVHVFVSSTFRDMQTERYVLATTTFPMLQQRFRARGVDLVEVDLRWGVTEADVTLEVCLAEVDHCKPWFIGLLGQRYGTALTDREVTPELLQAFPFVHDEIGLSLTEIEIQYGVLDNPEGAKNALFFKRDRAWLDTLPAAERMNFEEDSELQVKLRDLDERIGRVAAIWDYSTPLDIGPAVERRLGAALEERFPEKQPPDAFTEMHRLHAGYARERLRGPYVGGEPYFEQIDQWIADRGAPPILIMGASGAGKSALVAHWVRERHKKCPNDILFAHYLVLHQTAPTRSSLLLGCWNT